MTPIDKKMFEAIRILEDREVFEHRQEFCDAIKMDKQTLNNVKLGRSHFRPYHIKNACQAYGINANWILGLSDQFSRVTAEIKFIGEAKLNNKKVNKVKRKTAK